MLNKKFLFVIFSLLLLVSTIFMINGVNATVAVALQTANRSNISGSYLLNATLTDITINVSNVSFYYQAFGASTWTKIATVFNTTQNQTNFTTTWDTTAITDGRNYTLNVTVLNNTGAEVNATYNFSVSVTIDNTPPTAAVYGIAPTAYSNGTIRTSNSSANNLTLSIYVTDATFGMANFSSKAACFVNVNGGANVTIPMFYSALTTGWCNASDTNASTALNLTGLTSDGNYTINIYVNDTVSNASTLVMGTRGNNLVNRTLNIILDTTAPVSSAACSPSTVSTGESFPCTCTTTDATSGIDSTTSGGSSTSGSVTTTSKTGFFTYTCTAQDNAGLTAATATTYSVTQPPGSGSGGGATVTKATVYSNVVGDILPSVPSVVKGFSADVAIKEMTITVDNPAQSVKVTITKYSGKPAAVSVAKTGKVYQYMQIDVSNIKDKINNAKITAKVEKAWATANSIDKENVVMSKFDDVNGKWNELATTYASEDDTFYYYTAEVNSFSFFAISEKAVVTNDTGTGSGGIGGVTALGSKTWLWIVLGIVVVAVVAWLLMRKK